MDMKSNQKVKNYLGMDISGDCMECQITKNSTYGKTFNLIEKHSTYRQKE